ncbi:MAG TPA: hypothetical protein VHY84_17030 [Bryobacteraceae bacterium]|nr:hypothetical protein [Bryobacteraceae bacterium]
MKTYPYAFHIALDGNGINGFEGMAGMCLFLFDPADNSYAYKVKYYDGASAGHACMVSPDGQHGYLGNAGQHLLFYDAATIDENDRISTLRYEANDTTIRGSTHVVWLGNTELLTPIGDYFYRFSLGDLSHGERLMPHKVKLPHGIKRSPSGRYLAYGSMDNPAFGAKGEAKEIGILDLKTGEVSHLEMPTTCWHLASHPTKDLFYAVSFRVLPQDHVDYHEWAMAFLKEYAYEIDPAEGRIVRHWSTSRETPAHINSDITVSDTELLFCNGGSQTIVCVDLETFAKYRVIDERPDFVTQLKHPRQMGTQIYDVLARGGFFTSARHLMGAMRVSRFTFFDAIYACQLSKDQSLLFSANRGLNHITVYNYPDVTVRLRVKMPDIHEYVPSLATIADPRLGFHHSYLVSPAA